MAIFSKRHYEKIAAAINDERNVYGPNAEIYLAAIDNLVENLCDMLQKDNPNFNRDKFRTAATHD